MMELSFLCEKTILVTLKKRTTFVLACFIMKTNWLFQFTFQIKNLKTRWILLLLIDGDKSHYVYIKDFDRFMFHRTKNKNKKYFCKSCLQCFSSKNMLTKHEEVCLIINGGQSVRKTVSNKYQFHLKLMLILSVI